MKVLCLEAHSILAYDDARMFHELGLEQFWIGSYVVPSTPHDQKRPALPQIPRKPELEAMLRGNDREDLPEGLVGWADVVYFQGLPDKWLIPNLKKLKGKRLIWRTIGQSNVNLEAMIKPLHDAGIVEIVRYSPAEKRFFEQANSFAGQDALIRFAKDPFDWYGWNGSRGEVGQVSQHTEEPHGRDLFTNWKYFEAATQGLPRSFAGPHSENIGGLGNLDYDQMRQYLRDLRCYCYTSTVPASYTLGLIEAMMTGVPVVSITRDYMWSGPDLFEADEIAPISCKDPSDANANLRLWLRERAWAEMVGMACRKRAIELFGWDKIKEQWRKFFNA